MLEGFILKLRVIVKNPYLNLAVGLLLLYTSASDAVHDFREAEQFRIGSHHGIILFALLHCLKTIPDLFESLEYVHKSKASQK